MRTPVRHTRRLTSAAAALAIGLGLVALVRVRGWRRLGNGVRLGRAASESPVTPTTR